MRSTGPAPRARLWPWLARRPQRGQRTAAAGLVLLAIAGIGWLDYVSGPDFGFSIFYIVPLAASGWWLGVGPTSVAAVEAAVAWFLADFAWRAPDYLPVSTWNAFTRLVIFLFVGLALAALRRDRERLRELLDRETRHARTDALTGLPNSRAFFAQLPGELARARRDGRALCVLYLDVDNFKQVNDRYGHAAGDQALQAVARELQGCLRAGDLTARLGGDEFAAVLWAADRDAVVAVAQRVIERIAALDDVYPGTDLGASIGAVHYAHPPAEADALLRAADQAMYEAKTSGKRTVVFRTGDGPRSGPVTRPDPARAR